MTGVEFLVSLENKTTSVIKFHMNGHIWGAEETDMKNKITWVLHIYPWFYSKTAAEVDDEP